MFCSRERRYILVAIWALVFSLVVTIALPARAQEIDEAMFNRIEANLMCTDGCGMNLAVCDNATAQAMRQEVRQQLAQGMSEPEIYAYMISIYGEEVMAAPPPHVPFNLVAWVAPFVGILLGGLVIYLSLDRWVFNRRRSPGPPLQESEKIDLQAYEEVLEQEIKKYL